MNALSLKTVGIVVGLLVVVTHVVALVFAEPVRAMARQFPRSRAAGLVLIVIDFLWTYVVAYRTDWGEFYYLQTPALFALPVFLFLIIRYVDEFLAVRALGILWLLLAAPVLDAAFLQPQASRLLVVILAYGWIVLGMLYVGQPHLLRDHLALVNRTAASWKVASLAGAVFGAAILVCAVAWY